MSKVKRTLRTSYRNKVEEHFIRRKQEENCEETEKFLEGKPLTKPENKIEGL
jgi:hypothetical protein